MFKFHNAPSSQKSPI